MSTVLDVKIVVNSVFEVQDGLPWRDDLASSNYGEYEFSMVGYDLIAIDKKGNNYNVSHVYHQIVNPENFRYKKIYAGYWVKAKKIWEGWRTERLSFNVKGE